MRITRALLPVLLSAPAAPAQPEFDPGQNMALDGTSVLKPQLPSDLPNPHRWRYTPGGRIKPGNVFDRFLVSSFIAPIFFREEDIGFGGGIAVTDIDFRNQGWREFANIVATASEEGQQSFGIHWRRWLHHRPLPEGGVLRDERSTVSLRGSYQRTLTRRFFGLGSETRAGDETSYTEELARVGAGARLSWPEPGDDLLVSLGVSLEHHGLQRGRVSTVPSTDDVFGGLFAEADGVDQLWLDAGLAYDTRDSVANPYTGGRLGFGVRATPLQTGLDAGAVFALDASAAVAVPSLLHDGGGDGLDNPPTDVLAFGGFVSTTSGDMPFYSLPRLGGDDTLRGYIQRRFTDRTTAHGVVEDRAVVVPQGVRFTDTIRLERISAALFYEGGTVADDLGDLGSARYLDSYGFGLRFALAREALFRFDLGFSREDRVLSISFGNSF